MGHTPKEPTEFNFDLDRMKAAVESPTVPIPTDALTSYEAFENWLHENKEDTDNDNWTTP